MSRAFRVQISVTLILVAVACLHLAAQVSPKKQLLQRRHNTDWEEVEDHDDGQTDDQFEGERDGGDRSIGQSRGFGGENRTRFRNAYPWLDILFRNPDDKFKAVQDGYLTGLAIQVEHNVLLAHKDAIMRASLYHGKTLVLQGWGNVWSRKFVDPSEQVWDNPKDSYARGVVRHLTDIGSSFGLYRVTHDRYPYPNKRSAGRSMVAKLAKKEAAAVAAAEDEGVSRQIKHDYLPPFDWPEGKDAWTYRYPRVNKDKDLKGSCYVYTLAAKDHGDYTWYDEKATRWLARWPVKQTSCAHDSCRFTFDGTRTDSSRMKRKGWQCDSWQDVGAPIMCGYPNAKFFSKGSFYERRYLMLSYLVIPKRPFYNETCFEDLYALRVADYADKIESEIDKLRKSGTL